MFRIITLAAAMLLVVRVAAAQEGRRWVWIRDSVLTHSTFHYQLTENTGGRAVALARYLNGQEHKTWTTGVYATGADVRAYCYSNPGERAGEAVVRGTGEENAVVAIPSTRKVAAWVEDYQVWTASQALDAIDGPWPSSRRHNSGDDECLSGHIAIAAHGPDKVYVVYEEERYNDDDEYHLRFVESTDQGQNWGDRVSIVRYRESQGEDWNEIRWPSLAVNQTNMDTVYVAYYVADPLASRDTVVFRRSSNGGTTWSGRTEITAIPYAAVAGVSVAAYKNIVVVLWSEEAPSGRYQVKYRTSTNSGASFGVEQELPLEQPWISWDKRSPNADIVLNDEGRLYLMLTTQDRDATRQPVRYGVGMIHGRWDGNDWRWESPYWLNETHAPEGDEMFPSMHGCDFLEGDTARAAVVWSDPRHANRGIWRAMARWTRLDLRVWPHRAVDGTGGNALVQATDGQLSHTFSRYPHVMSGPVRSGSPAPVLVGPGYYPTLAIDADNARWVAYVREGSVWVKVDYGEPHLVFAGSNGRYPGQPSIAVYPLKDNGDYVAALTFPVYDSANGSAQVLFAKVKTGAVLLDTIASNPSSLGDSFPSINTNADSTVFVIWQSDSGIVTRHKEFDPACWSAHPTGWGASTVLDAVGTQPSSMTEGGILHAAWRRVSNDGMGPTTYVVRRASHDLTSNLWTGWQDGGATGATGTRAKANPVYAGAGVTCWQEEVAGLWRIMGHVRGDTVTLVYSDSGAWHPHAVAESSAVGPSISQVRVHLLYTDGVVFEVDSAVFDTGVTKFKTCSLNVSAAGSNATGLNNGVKLIRKDGSDSLFAVYADLNGSLMYARSADGSEWTRTSLGSNLVQPTLAADSTGRQWAVSRYTGGLGAPGVRAASRDTAWSGFSEVYPTSQGIAGPASVAGASDDTEPCAWAAFLYNNCTMFGPSHFIIVAKFDGANLFLDTIATGGSGLGNPTIATEPADSGDFVHVCWEDNGEVRYTRTTTAIAADAWGGSLSLSWENPVNLSNSQGTPSAHPVVGADRQRIVVAWAEGGTPDILVRARSTDTTYSGFADTVNVSASEAASDHPSIAMGDSVVVVWEERHSQEDSDIRASVEFEAGFTVVDNEGRATYPFAVFQSKASGDSAIPLLHVIHSDAPQENYYEVGYAVRNLKTEGGGGQQSGGRTGPHIRPELAACRPNPFSRLTQIRYQFPREGEVLLRVYDASGRAVRTLAEGRHKPGVYTVTWDGTDARGRTVANGIYFYRLDAPGFRDVKKAVVMK